MVLQRSTPMVLHDSDVRSITLGEEYRTIDSGVPEPTAVDINISTARDVLGNVYSLKKGVSFSEIEEYLEKTDDAVKKIEPSNVSEQPSVDTTKIHKSFPTVPKCDETEKDIKCYVKGFLIFSSKGSNDDSKYRVTMIWLNQPTFIHYIKTGIGRSLYFDVFMVSHNERAGNSLFLKNGADYELPIKSDFYIKNFKNEAHEGLIDILSLN